MIECLICKTSVKDYRGLATHLRIHNINWKVYYDTYMKNPDEGKCIVCGEPTKIYRMSERLSKMLF